MKTQIFTGTYIPGGAKRQVQAIDPSTGKMVTNRVNYDLVSGLVLERVSSKPGDTFPNTGEAFVTISGQYGPGETCRITASSQHLATVAKALLKGNVDKADDRLPLLKEHMVTAIGTPMKVHGLLIKELYLTNDDGTTTTIIGAPKTKAEAEFDAAFLEDEPVTA